MYQSFHLKNTEYLLAKCKNNSSLCLKRTVLKCRQMQKCRGTHKLNKSYRNIENAVSVIHIEFLHFKECFKDTISRKRKKHCDVPIGLNILIFLPADRSCKHPRVTWTRPCGSQPLHSSRWAMGMWHLRPAVGRWCVSSLVLW